MRLSRLLFLFFLIAFARSATAQQATASSPQATALLQQSLAALTGGHPLTDVTLSGNAQRIAGSDNESGTATLQAIAAGASSVNLRLPSGTSSEVQNCSAMPPTGAWAGPDGVSHPIAFQNLLTGTSWFFPAFTIAQGLSGSGYVATFIGEETHNGHAVQHVSVSQPSLFPSPPGSLSSGHLSQVDIFLDSITFLPDAITFNIHPDNNALLDIPVEIDFSNYALISGVQVPFHVQKLINNGLALDLQFDSAVINSGLSATAFQVQ
jgi:hypothetical protein